MKIKIHSRNFDEEFRWALHAMVEHTLAKLVPSKRLRNNLEIDVHLRRHLHEGEAKLHEKADRYRPRKFRVIIDHHRLEKDTYGRVKDATEWAHDVLRTLAHELVHVKQYITGELTWRKWTWREDSVSFPTNDEGLYWKGLHYEVADLREYYELPYEIEAYGRERGLLLSFLAFWKGLIEKFGPFETE